MNNKNKNPLVSIITPCYNGENYISKFLDSILIQSYSNIELIIINDGSTDNTLDILESYKDKFCLKEISYLIINQENSGQAAAINKGLKLFKGEYLTWPDSDDYLHVDNIKRKVDYLEEHKEYGLVLCKSEMVKYDDHNEILGTLERKDLNNHYIFEDLIFERDIYFAPGGYMVRTSSFLDALPKREIYESKGGQNWQLLLPITYKYKCGFINEILYYYVVRENSHSRQEKNIEELINKTYTHEDIILNSIKPINFDNNVSLINKIKVKYDKKRALIAYKESNYKKYNEYYNILKKENNLTYKFVIAKYVILVRKVLKK